MKSDSQRITSPFRRRFETKTRIADARVDQQLRQVRLARELTQISPTVCFQYAMEGLANTGIVSYMDFVKQVRRYRDTLPIAPFKSQDVQRRGTRLTQALPKTARAAVNLSRLS